MSKEIRFSEVVKTAGHPRSVALWTNPARDKAFMDAVKANRVLTVIQQTHGTHKDFGQIGFHKQPLALYLIFPKALPRSEAHVIGLKYDLIEEPEVKDPVRIVRPEKAVQKRVEKQYEVVVKRTANAKTRLDLTAKTETEAKHQALHLVKEQPFDPAPTDIHDNILAVIEK